MIHTITTTTTMTTAVDDYNDDDGDGDSDDDTGRECPEGPNDKCSAMGKTLYTSISNT